MKTVTIGEEEYRLPETIEEMDATALQLLGQLLEENPETVEFKIKLALGMMKLTGSRKKIADTDLFRLAELLDFLDDKELRAKDKKGVWHLLPAEKAICREFYRNPFYELELGGKRFYSPEKEIRGLTLSQFAGCEKTAAADWDKDREAPLRFFSCFYTTEKETAAEERMEAAWQLDTGMLHYLKLHFGSCKKLLAFNHPELFTGKSGGDSSWVDTYHNLAGDKLGTMKEVEQLNVWVAYRIMSKLVKEHGELKRKYNL